MKILASLITAFFIFASSVIASYAMQPNNLQKSELKGLVADLNNAAAQKNMALIVNNMPEHLFKEMSIRLRMTEPDLRDNFLQQIQQQFANLPAGAYKLDAGNIEYKETNTGRFYALVPTKVEAEDKILQYFTLAIYENTKWHLIYGGQKTVQNPIFLEIYPDFELVNFPIPQLIKK